MRNALESYLGRFLLFTLMLLAVANLVSLGAFAHLPHLFAHSFGGSGLWGKAGAVPTLLVVSSAVVAAAALRENMRSGRLTAALALIQRLESARVQQTRSFLRANAEEIRAAVANGGSDSLKRFIDQNEEARAQQITTSGVWDDLAILEQSAIMSLNGMIPKFLEAGFYSTVVLESWPNIEAIVSARRRVLETDVYLQHFEALHRLALSGKLFAWDATHAKRRVLKQIRLRSRAFAETQRQANNIEVGE